jgi:hypothetical protein
VILPKAPASYDQADQDRLRSALQLALDKLEALPTGWLQWTGTASRVTVNADAPPTNLQLGQALKAVIDDLVLKVKS